MGRLIGDGRCHFQIVDLIVHPSYQDKGAEESVINQILNDLDKSIPKDTGVFIMADPSNIKLYQRHEFKHVYPDLYGMTRK